MGDIGGMFGIGGGGAGDEAAKASVEAAEIQAESQREAREMLQEYDEPYRQYREPAISGLAGAYGLQGPEAQQQFYAGLRSSPFYQAGIAGRGAGEEAIMRQQAATGGLRGGSTQAALYDYNTQLEQQALANAMQNQLGGLQTLAAPPSNIQGIAGLTAGIGQTTAQGQIAAAQAQQMGQQQQAGNLMGLANLGLQAYGAFSDRRLKDNIEFIGKHDTGHNMYSWRWNEEAEKLGQSGCGYGVIADEVERTHPEAVHTINGYKAVDYDMIGVPHG